MSDDNQTQDVTAPVVPESTPEDVKASKATEPLNTDISVQPNGSNPIDMPPEALESPTNDPAIIPVESDNSGLNQPESVQEEPLKEPETGESGVVASVQPAPAPLAPVASQTQSLAQQDQVGFIRTLLARAQAKIQFNKQKKLNPKKNKTNDW